MADQSQFDTRIADIQTSMAVLASSAATRDQQIQNLADSVQRHMDSQEKLISKIFDKMDNHKSLNDARLGKVEQEQAASQGAMTGARWMIAIVTGLSGIAVFLGLR